MERGRKNPHVGKSRRYGTHSTLSKESHPERLGTSIDIRTMMTNLPASSTLQQMLRFPGFEMPLTGLPHLSRPGASRNRGYSLFQNLGSSLVCRTRITDRERTCSVQHSTLLQKKKKLHVYSKMAINILAPRIINCPTSSWHTKPVVRREIHVVSPISSM